MMVTDEGAICKIDMRVYVNVYVNVYACVCVTEQELVISEKMREWRMFERQGKIDEIKDGMIVLVYLFGCVLASV